MEAYNIIVNVDYYEKKDVMKEKELDELYKTQFLKAMNESVYDENMILIKLDFLYNLLKDTALNNIFDLLCKYSSTVPMEDNKLGFYLLFSYDFYYITHSILCCYFALHEINDELYNVLEEKIESLYKLNENK
jgi:hypothetical protein